MPAPELDAVVVGSGPNGLAAAVTLARQGLAVQVLEAADQIGGGTRTAELTFPGVLHDVCSAIHPLAAGSPFLASLPLAEHGLKWRWPEVDLAHPLDHGRVAVLVRSLDETVAGLGSDGPAWRATFQDAAERFHDLAGELLGPLAHVPRHPFGLARFGLKALGSAAGLADRFRSEETRALFAGVAAHITAPLNRPGTASAGLLLIAAAHSVGWPCAAGGSQQISEALGSMLISLGGTIETGRAVSALEDLSAARVSLFDTSPRAFARMARSVMPSRTYRGFTRWKYGPGVFKLDLAVEGGVPWVAEPCQRAGTVHVGGSLEQIAEAEADVQRGTMPKRPFVIVAQQYLSDPVRSSGDIHPVWAYAHVPHAYPDHVAEAIIDQMERFAPGLRKRIAACHTYSAPELEAYNPNYVGGDIAVGANNLRQLLIRPRPALHPYETGIPGLYLCSAATPPGPGVHGMCGYHAARRALRYLNGQARSHR